MAGLEPETLWLQDNYFTVKPQHRNNTESKNCFIS